MTGARPFWPLALLALGLALTASLTLGDRAIPLPEVWRALTAPDGSEAQRIVTAIRLPRSLMALQIGAALGLAGALMQALTRNPLADPGLFGVNAGAGLAVLVAASVFGLTALPAQIGFALVGAALGAGAVAVFALRRGADPVTLTLAGIAVAAVMSGLATALALRDPGAFDRLRHWAAGSLGGARMASVGQGLPFVMAGLGLSLVCARGLNALALGDEIAAALGTALTRLRLLALLAVLLLAGTATALAGPVAFVGLMAPHLARRILGADQRRIMAGVLLVAPTLVLAADVAGRLILPGGEVPVSIVTAFLGAPLLIALARGRAL